MQFLFLLFFDFLIRNKNITSEEWKTKNRLHIIVFIPPSLLLDTATWPCQVKEYKIVSEPSLLTGWLASWLAGQLAGCVVNLVSNFKVKAVKMRGENCKRGCTPTFSTLSISQSNVIGRDGWLTSFLTPVNEDVYAMQYENKDAEVQTVYS